MTVIYDIILHFFFFLNQQFITRSVVAGHGSYFVTMYRRNMKNKERKKKRKERQEEGRKKEKENMN